MLQPQLFLMLHRGVVVVGHRGGIVLMSNSQHDDLGVNHILNGDAAECGTKACPSKCGDRAIGGFANDASLGKKLAGLGLAFFKSHDVVVG